MIKNLLNGLINIKLRKLEEYLKVNIFNIKTNINS